MASQIKAITPKGTFSLLFHSICCKIELISYSGASVVLVGALFSIMCRKVKRMNIGQ